MPRLSLLPFLCLALAGPVRGAELPAEFDATYTLYRNGKLMGETRIRLDSDAGQWMMISESKGTKGMARFLGFQEQTTSQGQWLDGEPRPDSFEQHIDMAFKKRTARADFDWAQGTVKSVYEDGEAELELVPGLLDPGTAGLAVRAGLRRGENQWVLPMLDEDEIDEDQFRARPAADMDTALGCLRVRTVEKIRGPESKRYTRTAHAARLDFVPVFVEHGKEDGDHMETRIVALTLDGQPVSASDGCAP